jgi:hypothetical protein
MPFRSRNVNRQERFSLFSKLVIGYIIRGETGPHTEAGAGFARGAANPTAKRNARENSKKRIITVVSSPQIGRIESSSKV